MSLRMGEKKLANMKYELNSLELDMQQWSHNLYSLFINKEKKFGQLLFSNEDYKGDNKADLILPLRFDQYEDEIVGEAFMVL